jgi:hypothetical protein
MSIVSDAGSKAKPSMLRQQRSLVFDSNQDNLAAPTVIPAGSDN